MRWERVTAVTAGIAILSAASAGLIRSHIAPSVAPRWDVAAERDRRDADIAWYRARAARDPSGAFDRLRLSALYLQRARERGSPNDLVLAETEARHSLANRRAHNHGAFRALAIALIGQHRFAEAAEVTDSLLLADPSPGTSSLRGEIALEQGEYHRADSIFTRLDHGGVNAAVTARVARWAAVRGRSAHARTLLQRARTTARSTAFTPAEQIAWYDLRLGELALTVGEFDAAEASLKEAAAVAPDDPRILLAEARLALARARPAEALRVAERAMARGEDPMAFALAADALRTMGRDSEADRMIQVFETILSGVPTPAWHRQWKLALLDHGRQRQAVLAQAAVELQTRRDVYGLDLFAWALFKSGNHSAARGAMREALAWGTEDRMLWSHAAAIGIQP